MAIKIVEPSYEIIDCPDGEEALAKIERIGRECYQSASQVRTDSSEPSSHSFVRMILRHDRRSRLSSRIEEMARDTDVDGNFARDVVDMVLDDYRDDPPHDGLLEHVSVTVRFVANRGFTHELVRGRMASYAQESTRYCNYSRKRFGESISVVGRKVGRNFGGDSLACWMGALECAEERYLALVGNGVAPEIARDVLPHALKAGIIITANLSSWRNIFRKRCSPRAHPDMRSLMIPLLDEMRDRIPIVFDELI